MRGQRLRVKILGHLVTAAACLSAGLIAGLILAPDWRPAPTGRAAVRPVAVYPAASAPLPASPPLPWMPSPFVVVARRVVPAVVYVDTKRKFVHPGMGGGDNDSDDLLRRFFPRTAPREEIEIPSSGSGFIIDGVGHILTNNHVVAEADEITVHLADGRYYPARVIGTDAKTDVAVIALNREAGDPPLPILALGNSDSVEVGEWAIAIGNPLGELEGSVTVGVISAKGRSDLSIAGGGPDYQDFLQTDASINFGNSGGPLVNTRGEVIGINTAINTTGQGLGFAIPINMARNVASQLIATGTVTRAYVGIVPQQLTPELAEGLGLRGQRGVLVASVERGGPGDQAGLRQKDIIVAFNGLRVSEVNRFRRLVAEASIDTDVELDVLRGGRTVQVRVHLARRPDEVATTLPPHHPPISSGAPDFLGAELATLTRKMAEEMEIRFVEGVVVVDLSPGSPCAEAGLEEGDVVVEINDVPVASPEECQSRLKAARGDNKPLLLLMSRNGSTSYVALKIPNR